MITHYFLSYFINIAEKNVFEIVYSFVIVETLNYISQVLVYSCITHSHLYTAMFMFYWLSIDWSQDINITVESIVVVFVGRPPPRIYILYEFNTNFERVSFLTEAENLRILKIASPQITKNPQSTKIGPHKFKRFHTKQIEFFFKLTQSFNRF